MRAVLFVRHGDADVPPSVPDLLIPLNQAGRARAAELARVAAAAGVTAVFTSGAARTQQAAGPLAAALRLAPVAGQRDIKKKAFADHRDEPVAKYGAGFEKTFGQPDAGIRWRTTGGYVARPPRTRTTGPCPRSRTCWSRPTGGRPCSRSGTASTARCGAGTCPGSRTSRPTSWAPRSCSTPGTPGTGTRDTGHEFGTPLAAAEKRAPVLYLKGMK